MGKPKPKVRDFLKQHGIKQAWLAKQLGMSTSLIRHYLDEDVLDEEVEANIRTILLKNGKEVVSATKGASRRFI